MKKSEMTDKIFDYLLKNTDIEVKRLYSIAEDILVVCEEFGMKPPVTKRCPVLLTNIHTWEQENENA